LDSLVAEFRGSGLDIYEVYQVRSQSHRATSEVVVAGSVLLVDEDDVLDRMVLWKARLAEVDRGVARRARGGGLPGGAGERRKGAKGRRLPLVNIWRAPGRPNRAKMRAGPIRPVGPP
jgi:hypothetical protein